MREIDPVSRDVRVVAAAYSKSWPVLGGVFAWRMIGPWDS
jgi:hypothetical protein